MLTAAGLGLLLLLVGPASPEPPGCAVTDSHGRCLVIAVDPGRPGRSETRDPDESISRSEPDGDATTNRAPVRPEPPQYRVRPFGDGGWVQQLPIDPADFLLPPLAGAAPAADPAAVAQAAAQRAIELLTLDPPEPRTSADDSVYVGVPVWLWIEGGPASTGPVSATATAGAARVTATGRLSSVEWSMGPAGAAVRCAGPGTPWTGQSGPSPDCGYTYDQRSLPERTGGVGRWTVTVTGVWTVTWAGVSAGEPVTGEQIVRVSTQTSLAVGEIQVLVGGTR